MLHAVIIDDEYNGLRSLELLIEKFIPELKVVAMSTDPLKGIELINNYRPDIVFLDINMPSLNGFELIEQLQYSKFHLVFTTAHQEFAIKAIKQAAVDYLLKPIDLEELKGAIERVQDKIKNEQIDTDIQIALKKIVGLKNLKIAIPTKASIEYVFPESIIYIEADSNSAKVLLTNMALVQVNKSLKDYEQLLCREGLFFIRIHNSFIVNLNYVIRYMKENGGQLVMYGDKIIPVSKHKKPEFFANLNIKEMFL